MKVPSIDEMADDRVVAVDRENPMTAHDPDSMASLIGMEVVPLKDVRDQVVVCGVCFADDKKVQWEFPYLREMSI